MEYRDVLKMAKDEEFTHVADSQAKNEISQIFLMF